MTASQAARRPHVPQQAVVVRDGFSYAFTVSGDQDVQLRKLQVERRIAGSVEILEGANAQQPVSVQGASFLSDVDLARVGASTENFWVK